MFKRRTLFILGAGSSAEAGFPVGTELAEIIGKKMDIRFEHGMTSVGSGDMDLFSQITARRRHELNQFQASGWLIRDGIRLSQSIDDFLDLHRNNELVNLYGKAAIVKSILEAERKSKLYFDDKTGTPSINVDRISDTWFVKFMHMLGRGVPKENVREIFDHVSFIVFNYDRCVEHFLTHALPKLYGIHTQDAVEIVRDLQIIHPYGVVANVPFGAVGSNYVALAAGIKTYTEQIAAADMMTQLAAEIHRADCIVFLGFAYHSQNMMLLRPSTPVPLKPVFGTAYGMSEADRMVVFNQIGAFFPPSTTGQELSNNIKLHDFTSAKMFDHYAKSLTGGD